MRLNAFFPVFALCALLLSACAQDGKLTEQAQKPDLETSLSEGQSVTEAKVAMAGFDPVAMLETAGDHVQGSDQYTAEYEGAVYQFASKANRDQFTKNPTRFAPKYAGWCAWGVVAENDQIVNVPHLTPSEVFWVWNGTTYGFYNRKVQERFESDPVLFDKLAEVGWRQLQEEPKVWDDVADEVRKLRTQQAAR